MEVEKNLMIIMKNLKNPDDQEQHDDLLQESFSFTSFDLRSSMSLFSDDDDDEEEETYIEIALEQPQENTATSTTPSSPPQSLSMAAATRESKGKFLALERLLNVFMSALKGSSLKIQEDKGRGDDNNDNGQSSVNSGGWKLVKSRKTPKVTTTTTNNRVTKFFIKFQSINLRSMLTPILKPSRKTNMYLTNGERSSRALGMNLDSIKGVLEAMTTRTKRTTGSTVKLSPSRGIGASSSEKKTYARENSVQGAIAHCKRSFTPDGGW